MIKTWTPRDPRVVAMMNAQQQEIEDIYTEGNITEPFDPSVLEGEGSVLLVDLDEANGKIVACGALKAWSDGRTAEVKRMYTVPERRREKRGRKLLDELIERGRAIGYARIVLETGDRMPMAIAMYESRGFTRIENYGFYAGVATSVCFELSLTPSQ